jgi:PhnB protein
MTASESANGVAHASPGFPDGFRSVTPIIYLSGAAAAIDFYVHTFGARELKRVPGPGNTVAHAEIAIGDCTIVVVDQLAGSGHAGNGVVLSPRIELLLYTDDVDRMFGRAVDAGARVTMPLTNVFWGDRYGRVMDPFGQVWSLATRLEHLSVEEILARSRSWVPAEPEFVPADS